MVSTVHVTSTRELYNELHPAGPARVSAGACRFCGAQDSLVAAAGELFVCRSCSRIHVRIARHRDDGSPCGDLYGLGEQYCFRHHRAVDRSGTWEALQPRPERMGRQLHPTGLRWSRPSLAPEAFLLHLWEFVAVLQPRQRIGSHLWLLPISMGWAGKGPEVKQVRLLGLLDPVQPKGFLWARPEEGPNTRHSPYEVEWLVLANEPRGWWYLSTWHLLRGYFEANDRATPAMQWLETPGLEDEVWEAEELLPAPLDPERMPDASHFDTVELRGHRCWRTGSIAVLIERGRERFPILASPYEKLLPGGERLDLWQPIDHLMLPEGCRLEAPPLRLADKLFLLLRLESRDQIDLELFYLEVRAGHG